VCLDANFFVFYEKGHFIFYLVEIYYFKFRGNILIVQNMRSTICAVYVSNNTYIKQKEIAEKFSFHRFPKARHLVSQIIRKEWIVRCRRKLRLQQSKFMMM
jgi:hypothetical protein